MSLGGLARRVGGVAAGLFLFVLALETIKRAAFALSPVMRGLDVDGPGPALGFGWLMACVVLSGSPVAATALALLASGALRPDETFGMIGGSRLGASFVVLVAGAIDDLRSRRREKRSAYVGVAALLTTAIVYVPALGLGALGLEKGVLAGLRFEGRRLGSLVGAVFGPPVSALASLLPSGLLFVAGVATLVAGFRLFDSVLPDLRARESPVTLAARVVYRPWFMFLVGLGVTAVTLSVSVSLSLLVPLTAKGYVRRENVVPYIMGANISTFDDTLFAAALVGHPEAVRLVALIMGSVTLLSLPAVFLFPYAFERAIDRVAVRATASGRALLAFVALVVAIPALLILFG